ncbi:MAG: hypothetical protein ACP5GU_04035 [Thermoprotei archaeon]|jgi:hypothetical protein
MKYTTALLYLALLILLFTIANYADYWTIVYKSIIILLNSRPLYIIIVISLIMAPISSLLELHFNQMKNLDKYSDEIFGLLLIIILIYIFIFYNSSITILITEPLYIISILLVFAPLRIILEHLRLLIRENNPLKIGMLTVNFYIFIMIISTSQTINIRITDNYLQDLGFKFSMLTLYIVKYMLPSVTFPITLEQSITYIKMIILNYKLPESLGILFIILMIILLFKPDINEKIHPNSITILFYSSIALLTYLLLFNDPLLSTLQLVSPWILLLLTIVILSTLGVLK